jgi:hypothetical protein
VHDNDPTPTQQIAAGLGDDHSKSGYQAAEGGVIPRLFHFHITGSGVRGRWAKQGANRNDCQEAMRSEHPQPALT